MKKACLIICCDNTSSGKLKGALLDAKNYYCFLRSDFGGCWYENEIFYLRNPSEKELRKKIKVNFRSLDYSLIIFSGHGYFNRQHNQQYIELKDADVPIGYLDTKSPKQSIIIDSCRDYVSNLKLNLPKFYHPPQPFIGDPSETGTRELYERLISKSENGISVYFSSQRGQSAEETNKGGLYSFSLLKVVEHWLINKSSKAISFDEVHKRAIALLKDIGAEQIPTKNTDNKNIVLPFAVKYDKDPVCLNPNKGVTITLLS